MPFRTLRFALLLAAPLALAAQQPSPVVVYSSNSSFGAGLSDLNDQRVKDFKLKSLNGVELTSVDAASPAGKAGLRPGDVIVNFNGQNVIGVRELQRLVSETPGGRTVPVEIVRDGRNQALSLTLDSRPTPAATALEEATTRLSDALAAQRARNQVAHTMIDLNGPPTAIVVHTILGGVTTESVSGQLGAYFGLQDGQNGVLVDYVKPDSVAARAGLQAGDVITAVNGKPFGAAAATDFAALSRSHAGETMNLDLLRKGTAMKISVPPAASGG